jgi:hypothetical protein
MRLRVASDPGSLAGFGVLPAVAPAPYRIWQLDWSLSASDQYVWRHEIDRAWASWHGGGADVTIGRQAIGWGRGVVFSAIDLFAPFAPLEADREWRRGVDAVHAEVRLADHWSTDGAVAFGPTLDESIAGGRLRGFVGKVDAEAVAGWRARDVFWGGTSSAAVGKAELHGEIAVFHTPEDLPAHAAGDRTVVKAVAGASYQWRLGHGLFTSAEYHYSGFGAAHASEFAALVTDPRFVTRLLRGDVQIMGRHAAAMLASYEMSPTLALSLQVLASPVDGSGVVAPTAVINVNDHLSIRATGYTGWGAGPSAGLPASEYGATPRALFLQAKIDF